MARKASSSRRPTSPPFIFEKDVSICVRDGVSLKADIFRPRKEGVFPAIVNLGPYQKDKVWIPPADLEEEANPYMNWEVANPVWWVPKGYALVRIDTRGSGKSPGQTDLLSLQEAKDFYDAIEWTAKQSWSNGAVGTLGISYFAINQWLVATLKPPSLKAIIPWEGAADMYRDFCYHGGIFGLGFVSNWFAAHMAHHLLGQPQNYNPDTFSKPMLWEYMRNSLDLDFYKGRQAVWDDVEVPMLSTGNWSGMGLHLRGNIEGYMRAKSKHKKLRVHSGTHFHPFHSHEGRADQLRFFDHWLKGIDNGVMKEPPVKLQIRVGGERDYKWRLENEWPLARTEWTKFYLAPPESKSRETGALTKIKSKKETKFSYSASRTSKRAGTVAWSAQAFASADQIGLSFETAPLNSDTEVTGPVVLVLWASSTTEDMDIFATIRNIAPDGSDVLETGQQGQKVPVAKGWLRASHRNLDHARSLPYRPYHSHDERRLLRPGEVVRLDVEIWPTCMVFKKGHRIRLDVQPCDGIGSAPYTHYSADYNTGANTIYVGGARLSHLLLPIIPAAASKSRRR